MRKVLAVLFAVLVFTSCEPMLNKGIPLTNSEKDVMAANLVDVVRWTDFFADTIGPGYTVTTAYENSKINVTIEFDDYADEEAVIKRGSVVYTMSGFPVSDKPNQLVSMVADVEIPADDPIVISPDVFDEAEEYTISGGGMQLSCWKVWDYDSASGAVSLSKTSLSLGGSAGYTPDVSIYSKGELTVNGTVIPFVKIQGFAESGSGTQDDPYIIMTADQLRTLRDMINTAGDAGLRSSYFALGADIDLENKQWIPIANGVIDDGTTKYQEATDSDMTSVFQGYFDGRNHTIRNLRISYTPANDNYVSNDKRSYLGLFGVVGDDAAISNLTIDNVNIQGNSFIGAIAGFIPNYNSASPVVLDNIHVTGDIRISGKSDIGGLIGRAEKARALVIKNCSVEGNEGSVITNADGFASNYVSTSFVGGLIGTAYGNKDVSYESSVVKGTLITGCTVSGIEISGSVEAVGGLAGHFELGTIQDSQISGVDIILTENTNIEYLDNTEGLGAVSGTMMAGINDANRIKLENIGIEDVTLVFPVHTNVNAEGVIGRFRGNASDKSETDYIEGLDNLDLGGLTINNPEEV